MARRIGPPRALKYVAISPASGIASLFIFYVLFSKMFPRQFPMFIEYSGLPVPGNFITIIYIDLFIVFLLAPISIYARKYIEYMQKLKEQARSFLQVYPSVAASMTSVSQAIIASLDLVEEPLKDYLEAFAYLYNMTGDLEGSFLKIFSKTPKSVRLLLTSILTTARSGGRSEDVLSVTSKYASELQRMDFYLRNRLQPYSTVIFLGAAVFGFSVGMTSVMLEILRRTPSFGLSKVTTYTINVHGIVGIFFYSLLILSASASYIIAKVIYDHALKASEYFIYLTLIGTLTMMIALATGPKFIH